MLFLIWVVVLISLVVIYLRQVYTRFSHYGVKHFTPIPFLGNMTRILLRYDHFTDDVMRLYNSFPEEKFVGTYEFVTELIMIRDIELVKKVFVKDFEYFYDHRFNLGTSDSFFSRNLFSLKGPVWKNMRGTLSPAFTGSKMRVLLPLMSEVGEQMTSYLQKKIEASESGYLDTEYKDMTTRYAIDVIASCIFGLKVNSYSDEDNEFYALGKGDFTFHSRQLLQSFIIGNAPTVAKFFKVDFLSEASKKFFKKMTLETMADREKRNITRPDTLHLLMEARKAWTDDELVAQGAFFFFAGVDSVSSGLSFMLYELALNPDVQDRLVQEIKETDAKNGGKLDLSIIENMTYMDMVVSEVLRLWPPGIAPDRICTRDYNLGKPNDKAECSPDVIKLSSLEAKRRISSNKMLKNPLYRYGNENARIPAHINFAKEVYDSMVKHKDVTALINADTEDQMSYGELAQMTADVALSLTHMGVRKGEVVCICSEKNFEYMPTVLGIMCAGATFSPTDPSYGSSTFEEVGSIQHYILYGNEVLDGAILFKDFLTETAKLEDFQPVPVNGWEDVAFIVYSSGTTGLPKGVPVTHLAFLLNSQNITTDEYTGMGIYNSREFYYTYGLTFVLACLRAAATIVYNPSGGEKAMLEAIQKYKIKVLQLAPLLITELLKSAILGSYDVSTVEHIVTASTYIREEEVNAIRQRIPNLVSVLQGYGMSQAPVICYELGSFKGSKPGSSGMPCNGYVIKVVNLNTREPLGPNQRGEICVKGPSVMKGYLNNLNPDCKDEEGFLKTGDVGYYDDDGYFFIVNRIKELIKFNDISIAPAEFEAILLQHPSVREAGVVGKPHPTHGEAPVAFIVLQPGCTATEEELVQHVNSRVTFRMRLAGGVRFIERLPRGVGDKLDRKDLLQRLLDEDAN